MLTDKSGMSGSFISFAAEWQSLRWSLKRLTGCLGPDEICHGGIFRE